MCKVHDQEQQIENMPDRLTAVELKLEHAHGPKHWHTHKRHVEQWTPEHIAHEFDFGHAHLPKDYR